jgi:hypothetical protein
MCIFGNDGESRVNANAKAWIRAMRLGEFRQGRGALAKLHNGKLYCCPLGVACELARAAGAIDYTSESKTKPNGVREYGTRFGGQEAALPREVADWLGLKPGSASCIVNGEVVAFNPRMIWKGEAVTLTDLNDKHELTFPELADAIEANSERLFE